MTDRRRHHILTINNGSSSRKFSLYDLWQSEASEELVFSGQMERIGLGDSLFYASNSDSKGLIEQHLQLSDTVSAARTTLTWISLRSIRCRSVSTCRQHKGTVSGVPPGH